MSDQDAAKQLERRATDILRERMRDAGRYVAASVRVAAPSKTGKLRKSVTFRKVESRTRIGFRVRAGQFARFLEFGTRNRPRKDGKPSRGGQWHIKPSLWFEKAFLSALPQAMNIIQRGK